METEAYHITVFEAEQKLLAGIIADSKNCSHILLTLKPVHFSDSRHQVIFSTVMQIVAACTPLDLVTLKAQLIKNRQLEMAGGLPYINTLKTDTVDALLSAEYVRLVLYAAQKKLLGSLGAELNNEAQDPSINPGDSIKNALQRIFEIDADRQPVISFAEEAENILFDTMQYLQNSSDSNCVYTGFAGLDNICKGFHKGELIVVAGRPAMGKTAFSISLMLNLSLQQKLPLAYFSLEMSARQLSTRLLAAFAEVNSYLITSKQLDDTTFKKLHAAAQAIKDSDLYIADEPGLTIQRIRFLASRLKQQQGIRLIIVDYLQLIGYTSQRSNNNRAVEVAEITRGLKTLARELDITVIVLSQLSRAVEVRGGDKKPILSDLRESGAIEQEADKVLFLYRGEYYGLEMDVEGNPTKDIAEIIVAKNRSGAVGTTRLRFSSRFAHFENLSEAEGIIQNEVVPSESDIENRIKQKYKIFGELNDEHLSPPF